LTGGKHLSHVVVLLRANMLLGWGSDAFTEAAERAKERNSMNDKEWLEKVDTAFKVYEQQIGPNNDVVAFVDWLFKQYGIVHKDKH